MKINTKPAPKHTHEGGVAKSINPEQQLRRSVMSCMLWEREFYESGASIADRICEIIPKVSAVKVAQIATEARVKMKLRHVPLLIVREMARIPSHKHLVASALFHIIQRPDELTEFMAIYWKDGKQPLSAQVKIGLARAFTKFDEYQLAKYNRDGAIKLKDVLFLCHAKPLNGQQALLWKRLIEGKLRTPDTWEVALSGGSDKKDTFTRLIKAGVIGGMALLRNLRNMEESGVERSIIRAAILSMKADRILPFRFISAARHAPNMEPDLELAMFRCLKGFKRLGGRTLLLMDVSYSMEDPVSEKSNITRMDAGCALGMLLREICQEFECISFSNQLAIVPPRRGFALRDAIVNSQPHSGTALGNAVGYIQQNCGYDRLIVITDEQSNSRVPDPIKGRNYIINVASCQNGVGYGKWIHIDGWSEAVVDYVLELEDLQLTDISR